MSAFILLNLELMVANNVNMSYVIRSFEDQNRFVSVMEGNIFNLLRNYVLLVLLCMFRRVKFLDIFTELCFNAPLGSIFPDNII